MNAKEIRRKAIDIINVSIDSIAVSELDFDTIEEIAGNISAEIIYAYGIGIITIKECEYYLNILRKVTEARKSIRKDAVIEEKQLQK